MPTGEPAPDRGTFAIRAFPQLLADLHRSRATGALLLRRDKVKKIVFFREGAPESVKSNLLSECLGRVMVRERMISEAECEESLKRMKASGRQQGTVLIEMGCISPHNLRYALELQLRLKLLEVFGWTRGEFQFNPKAQPPAETVRLQMSTAAIVYEGVKRSYDAARLLESLGEIAGKYVHPAEDPLFAAQDMSLGEEEAGLLALMDGSRTVRELRRRGPLSPLDTDRFLYALLASQMVELRSERRTGRRHRSRPRRRRRRAPGTGPGTTTRRSSSSRTRCPPATTRGTCASGSLGALAAMRRMDYFELLGLRHDAPAEAVRSAAMELLREYRVDGPTSSAEVQTLVQQIADLVGQAHDTLVEPGARARYEAELRAGGVKHEVGEAVGRMLEAESAFRRGEQLLASGDVPRGVRGVQRGRAAAARRGRVPGAPRVDHPRPGPVRRRRRSTGAEPARRCGGAEPDPGPGPPLQGTRPQGAGTDRRGAGRVREGSGVQPGLHRGAPRAEHPHLGGATDTVQAVLKPLTAGPATCGGSAPT